MSRWVAEHAESSLEQSGKAALLRSFALRGERIDREEGRWPTKHAIDQFSTIGIYIR